MPSGPLLLATADSLPLGYAQELPTLLSEVPPPPPTPVSLQVFRPCRPSGVLVPVPVLPPSPELDPCGHGHTSLQGNPGQCCLFLEVVGDRVSTERQGRSPPQEGPRRRRGVPPGGVQGAPTAPHVVFSAPLRQLLLERLRQAARRCQE